ncbi:MAG TPA: elongation factor P maturation arginine rhamnosyltransferase EarP [Rhodocyclaceae bacterium]|nr:elongation factor P maturation arginine rhamnosyltransferase EarP [Rhodocyclaceae bacterium]
MNAALPSADRQPRWDIFCNVIDNFGDVGVCWRLARQLAAEHGLRVRLWVDALESFAQICPELDPGRSVQTVRGTEIRRWSRPFAPAEPADVAIEAFACDLPEAYVAAMSCRAPPPVWINLEYLSAEDWVAGCHGLPSPQALGRLTKWFYFPGFAPQTGGLVRERDLPAQRDAFQRDPAALEAFRRAAGPGAPPPGALTVSLFGYANPAAAELLAAWEAGPEPVRCLVPEGPVVADAAAFAGSGPLAAGDRLRRGSLDLRVLPFTDQDGYDRLLWACDLNFVRGEDSFVRAQWAALPMVWQIYPQAEDAHWPKLRAFLDRYCVGLEPGAAAALRTFAEAWNRGAGAAAAWPAFAACLPALRRHARAWADHLGGMDDLATRLVRFCRDRVK